jgi:signal transduction histidine kinase
MSVRNGAVASRVHWTYLAHQLGVALAASVVTLVFRALGGIAHGQPLPGASLYPAVVVSGWLGGGIAGFVSTAIGLVALFADLPARPRSGPLLDIAFFALNGALVSGFCQRLRQARDGFAAEIRRKEELQRQNAQLYAEAQRANRVKDEFLAVLSHELRTPLNAIVGWSEMMRGGRLAEEMTGRALEVIHRNAKVASQLLGDLLDVSRIVAGKFALERAPTDLRAIVTAAVETLRCAADDKRLRLTAPPASGEPLLTNGDTGRLQQVALNLLGNAIKFTPSGGAVRVLLRSAEEGLELVVEDEGIGIHPDLLPHVFERFRQGDSSTTRQHRGLGLGLTVVRHVVELHDGTITAESAGEGRGACFVVRLPRLAPEHAGEAAPVAAGTASG